MEISIEWGQPQKVKFGTVSQWRRTWHIPKELRGSFFDFWKENKFDLLPKGFRVFKEEDEWFLSETKLSLKDFEKIGVTRNLDHLELSDFVLPDYIINNISGLRPWQVDAAGKLVSAINHWNAAIDGSDMGVGKTFTACAVVRELGVKTVVVCPKAVISSWEDVMINHFKMKNNLIGVINYEQLRIGKKSSKIASYVIPREKRRKVFQWKIPKDTLIIWDESQKLSNWKTKTAKTCIEAFKQKYKQLFISATNATNPLQLRTVGMSLKLFKAGQTSWYEWVASHGCKPSTWGLQFTDDPVLRKKVLKKLNKDVFIDRGVRLRRDDIPNFPDCELFAVLLNMDKKDTDQINSIYEEMERELKELERIGKNDKHRLVIELRHRQRIELIKVPLFMEMVEEAKDEGFSTVIFLNFTDSINALAERLNIHTIFDGKVGDAARERNVKKFQNNEENIILVNAMSGGSGLSLHDIHGGHPRLSLISPSYSPNIMRQTIGRIWRDSAKTKGVQKLICVSGTVEENVYHNVMKKLDNLDMLNDGDLFYSKRYTVRRE